MLERTRTRSAKPAPLEGAARTHERFAKGHVLGKIVLRVPQP